MRELSAPRRARFDWPGNLTFALGLILVMVGITYGIRPAGGAPTGWASPRVLILLGVGLTTLVAFWCIERRVAHPMLRLSLFRNRAYAFGSLSTFLSAISRGGLMFTTVIWLQGIWLPNHGYAFSETPLWAGILMLPLTLGMLVAGSTSGYLSDRYGARPFATAGMALTAVGFALLLALPTDFSYPVFGAVLGLIGLSIGLFTSPNRAAVMNSLPREHRGAGGAMNQTFQNSAQVLSIGIFFTLMVAGLSSTLPAAMATGLAAHGAPPSTADAIAHLPPISVLFAAFLGYNPIEHFIDPHVLATLPAHTQAALTDRELFPSLLAQPFRAGLHAAFGFAMGACVIAAIASALRGGRPAPLPVAQEQLAG
jgi:MFS family permease